MVTVRSTTYRWHMLLLHRFGRHRYRIRWTGPTPRFSHACTWCGKVDRRRSLQLEPQ